jgi:2-polyprenyl-3-methyl-5-hydroxy-6-metoxy-1,4-benzoquinol methylase
MSEDRLEFSAQQVQTLSFFDRVSTEWRLKAEGKTPQVNVIAQRNSCAHRIQATIPGMVSMLDLGCGTGELVLEMAEKGVRATGIDFAPEMIRACQQKRDAKSATGANFHCSSVFDYNAASESEDLISALGLIEYISPVELTKLLHICYRALRPGGALVLGSRNRLFNLFSLNNYTEMELALGTLDKLMREAASLATSETTDSFFANAHVYAPLPQPAMHARTGIEVNLRYQYTPLELAAKVLETGLIPTALFPIHYHAMPQPAAAKREETHVAFSNFMFETAGEDHRLVPFSSSFVLAAQKKRD